MSQKYTNEARLFKAFCDENRLHILALLRSGEKCACNLEEVLTISQSTLSHHMKILVESGVVTVRKDKKWSYYAISEEGAALAQNRLKDVLDIAPCTTDCGCQTRTGNGGLCE